MRPIALLAIALGGCQGVAPDRFAEAKTIIQSGCGSCHTVPGVHGAEGKVGPSLAGVGRRQVIAGYFPNTRQTMIRWISRSQDMLPGNAMPNSGLSPQQASQVADYLYTLEK